MQCFSGVLMLYVILRYFETGARKYLYLLAIALVIHFIDKETSFMYSAMLLLFLAVYFIARVTRNAWHDVSSYRGFIIALAAGLLLFGVGIGIGIAGRNLGTLGATEVASPADSIRDLAASVYGWSGFSRYIFTARRNPCFDCSRIFSDPRLYMARCKVRALF